VRIGRSQAPESLRIEAPGYLAQTLVVVPSADHHAQVFLKKAPKDQSRRRRRRRRRTRRGSLLKNLP
jgi:hypothetical protein